MTGYNRQGDLFGYVGRARIEHSDLALPADLAGGERPAASRAM